MKADDNRKLPLDDDLILDGEPNKLFEYIRRLVKALTGNYVHLANIINLNDSNTTTSISTTGAGHITVLPWVYSSITQGTFIFVSDVLAWSHFYYRNGGTQDDRINYSVYLAAGTYTLNLLHLKTNNSGIIDISLDNYATSEGTVDAYNASTLYNQITTVTGIVVATAGLYTLSLKVGTKNASSSSYFMLLVMMSLFRTA